MGLTNRTSIAALARQRQIAEEKHTNTLPDTASQASTPQRPGHAAAVKSGSTNADQQPTEMIRRLRTLVAAHEPSKDDPTIHTEREYAGLQDELHRVAHWLDQAYLSRERSQLPEFVEISDHYHGADSLAIGSGITSKTIQLDLSKPEGYRTETSSQTHSGPEETGDSTIFRLDSALVDLNSYRAHLERTSHHQDSGRLSAPMKELDFSKESAQLLRNSVATSKPDASASKPAEGKDLALSLINHR